MPMRGEDEALKTELRKRMEQEHGPLLGGEKLALALGHANLAAFRQARRHGRVDVPVFMLPKRQGYFALTSDVADWLAQARTASAACTPQQTKKGGQSGA